MPAFPWTQSIAAGATFDPLETWGYQYTERAGIVKIVDRATAVGLVRSVFATAEQISQEANVPAGGTAGVTPSDFNVPPIVERVKAGKRLSIRYRNPTGGAITVDGFIDLTEQGGGRR